MEPTTQSASGKIIAGGIIGLLVGFVAGVFWQDKRTAVKEEGGQTAVQGEESVGEDVTSLDDASVKISGDAKAGAVSLYDSSMPSDSAISVDSQTAGNTVLVREVATPRSVWVVVREPKEGGFGNILGAQRVAAGTNGNVSVTLLRSTVSGGRYYVVFHSDTGSSAFDPMEDALIPNILAEFSAK